MYFVRTEFLQPQHIWPYIQQNFMHHHSQVHYQGFHVSPLKKNDVHNSAQVWNGFEHIYGQCNVRIACANLQMTFCFRFQFTNNNNQQNNHNNLHQEQQPQHNHHQHVPSPISSNNEIDNLSNSNNNNSSSLNNNASGTNADSSAIVSDIQDAEQQNRLR